jgi:hypothetical protein
VLLHVPLAQTLLHHCLGEWHEQLWLLLQHLVWVALRSL